MPSAPAKTTQTVLRQRVTAPRADADRVIHPSVVAKHNTREDAWVILRGKVYDVTGFGHKHPGGRVIYTYAGKDITTVFSAVHRGGDAERMLGASLPPIGRVPESYELPPLDRDWLALKAKFTRQGLQNYPMSFLAFQVMHWVVLMALGVWLLRAQRFAGVLRWRLLAGVIIGYGHGHAGWLMHDLGHRSVVKSPAWSRFLHRVWMGAVVGSAATYWNTAHMAHHVNTNVITLDYDVHSEPLYAWTQKLARRVPRWILRFQWIHWFVIGPAISMFWMQALGIRTALKRRLYGQQLAILFHWTWRFWALGLDPVVWFISHPLSGAYLGHIFALNHTMLPMFDKEEAPKTFVESAFLTTQDISPSPFWNYFSGHLNFQVVHHLFPCFPRSSHTRMQADLVALAEKHGLPYFCSPVLSGVYQVYATLVHAADETGNAKPPGMCRLDNPVDPSKDLGRNLKWQNHHHPDLIPDLASF